MDKALSPTQPTTEWPLAVESGDAAGVESLLASGAHVEETFDKGETALMRASARGYSDVAQLLIGAGANVNARRDDGFTPLILAVFFGHEDVVRLLLDAGADASAQTKLGTTAERWAASRGFEEIVELLKEAEASRPARPQEPESQPHVETEPDIPVRVETEEVRPVVTSVFKPRELPFEPSTSSVEQRASKDERRDSLVESQEATKARLEAMVAASSVGAAREPDADTAAVREGTTFINNKADEGATVESTALQSLSSETAPSGLAFFVRLALQERASIVAGDGGRGRPHRRLRRVGLPAPSRRGDFQRAARTDGHGRCAAAGRPADAADAGRRFLAAALADDHAGTRAASARRAGHV